MSLEISTTKSFDQQQVDRIEKLRRLHQLRNEARTHNHQEVIAENARKNLPMNWESRKRKAEWILNDQREREEAAQKGEDYERRMLLGITATEAERIERKKKKKNPDQGFSNFEDSTVRQYTRLVKNMALRDMELYQEQKEKYGEAFYAGPKTIVQGLQEDRKEAIDNLVKSVEDQISKRSNYSRRRRYKDDGLIDSINERNERFNKKLERFYGEYTSKIKEDLERGTSI